MNPTSKFDTLKSWLEEEEDLTDVVNNKKQHWSQVSERKEDKLLSTSSQNCAGSLPEPQLPESLKLLKVLVESRPDIRFGVQHRKINRSTTFGLHVMLS
jgi:hypothetical protein